MRQDEEDYEQSPDGAEQSGNGYGDELERWRERVGAGGAEGDEEGSDARGWILRRRSVPERARVTWATHTPSRELLGHGEAGESRRSESHPVALDLSTRSRSEAMSASTTTLCTPTPSIHEPPPSPTPPSPSLSLQPSPTRSSTNSHSYPPRIAPVERPVPPLEPPDRGKVAYLFLLGAFSSASPSTLPHLFPTRLADRPLPRTQSRRSSGACRHPTACSSSTTSARSSAVMPHQARCSRSSEPSRPAPSVRRLSFSLFTVQRQLTHMRSDRSTRPAHQLPPQPETALAPPRYSRRRHDLLPQPSTQLVRHSGASSFFFSSARARVLTQTPCSRGSSSSRRASSTRSAARWPVRSPLVLSAAKLY